MADHQRAPDVGAPDPELKNSPILDWEDAEFAVPETESGVCHFNGVSYTVGEYVSSGNELLRCEERGFWIRQGPRTPS
ncbi:MAG: hypothetical protein OEQ18_11845 [Gammaproteobacteria bacterium]|nr:hypothetical protein [Gammaproteobacteria bacterium]